MIAFAVTLLLLTPWPCRPQGYPETAPPLPSLDPQLRARFPLAIEAVLGMGIRLQALQDDDSENFLVSPLGATALIGELTLGATGELRRKLVTLMALPNSQRYENMQIVYQYAGGKRNITHPLPYSTLHIEMMQLLKALKEAKGNYVLNEESALFYDRGLLLDPDFARGLRSLYGAKLKPLDFEGDPMTTQRVINEWASKNTNGLIPMILATPPSPSTVSVLANAIYFKAEWETPFSDTLNREGLFQVNPTKTVPVTYMINSFEQLPYVESATYRLIGLPYRNQELTMYIILPKKENPLRYNMKGFIKSLKSTEILETLLKIRRRSVVVKLPKMRISHSFSLLKQLKKVQNYNLKTGSMLTGNDSISQLENAVHDFENATVNTGGEFLLGGAAAGRGLRMDNILQHVVLSMNEKGTEAAAVAAATIDYMGGSKNFLVDSPFIFFINHEPTGVTLFWGSVANPTG